MQLIDFNKKKIIRKQNRNITTFETTCPKCGKTRYLRPCDAKRANMCASCRNKKGYASTVTKYGIDFMIPYLRKYRLINPSELEKQVACFLEKNSVLFEREKIIRTSTRLRLVDFYIPHFNLIIEVNGTWIHRQQKAQDSIKYSQLHEVGFDVLILPEDEILTGKFSETLNNRLLILEDIP